MTDDPKSPFYVLPPMAPPANRQRPAASKPKRVTGERFKLLNTFADFSLRDLDRAEIAAWLLLWRDSRDGIARTSQADLAKRAGTSERQIIRAVQRLSRAGLLVVVRRGGLRQGPSTYRVWPLRQAAQGDMGVTL